MLQVSEAFKQACINSSRDGYIEIKYGLYNKRAKGGISNITASMQPFSDLNKTVNEVRTTYYKYISCEPNRVKLNGSFYFIQDKTKPTSDEDIAFWSNNLSDTSGNFLNPPTITYIFNDYLSLTNLTLYFNELITDFNIYYYKDNDLIHTINVTNNTQLLIETNSEINPDFTFNKMIIEFKKAGEGNRFAKFDEVDFGVIQTFNKEQVEELDIREELDLTSNELSSNSLNVTINDISGIYDVLNPNNKLNTIEEKQRIEIVYYLKVNGQYSSISLGTFLLKSFTSKNNRLEIEAYDNTYFMDKTYYGSHFYQNTLVSVILRDLFDYFSYTDYIIADNVANMTLTGYFPNVEFREAIRLIAEACQAVVRKNRDNFIEIYKLDSINEISKDFEVSEMQNLEASASIYNNIIDVKEYRYELHARDTVYQTTLNQGEIIITFNYNPIKEDTLQKGVENNNYEIIDVYANACVVNVLVDNTEVFLTAEYYVANESTNRVKKDDSIKFIDDYSITSVENHFINSSNSTQIAQWKLSNQNISVDFNTLSKPYIQTGDKIKVKTKYDVIHTFVPTEITYNLSIMQTLKGEE